ncbi:MAG TPA: hypothetical protein VN381_08945 [Anaerovoracaceae bacterium]|nr:hypothetical protein [Anaerovoracaceae bacterium]
MNEKTQLRTALKQISEKFFAFREFPYVERDRLPEGVTESAAEVGEEYADSYGASLSGKELEALIMDFPSLEPGEDWERVGSILTSRFSPRLINLIFNLYQVEYHSDALKFLIRKFAEEADRRRQHPELGRFFWHFGKQEDYIPGIKTIFREEIFELDRLFQVYEIGEETPYALEIRRRCLEDAGYPLLLKNAGHLVYLIENAPEEQIVEAVTNHILSFDVLDPSNGVNEAVLRRLSEPSQSGKWGGYSGEAKRKFSQWCFCHRLKLHTLGFPGKYKTLSLFYEKVRRCYEMEGTPALVMDFDQVVIADFPDDPHSYFYLKDDFNREIKKWKEFGYQPSFLKKDEPRISARDHIIENKEDVCLLLRYEGVDKLYIKELMEIGLGLVPDFRRMNLE